MENHLNYIHFNPAKHGPTAEPRDWPDRSYQEWERRGLYPAPLVWEEPKNSIWGE